MSFSETETGVDFKRYDTRAALRELSAVLIPVAMFGMMFGAASAAAGYSMGVSLWASIAIFAGASQFVFLEVYREGVPGWSVAVAVFAINFRHLLYSAALGGKIAHFSPGRRLLGFFLLSDLQFAVTEKHHLNTDHRQISQRFYFVFGLSCYVLWIVSTGLGAAFGALIEDPATIGLDFVLPIYFLTILMGFRSRRGFAVIALISGVVAYFVQQTIGDPWHISLGALSGVGAAMLLGWYRGERDASKGLKVPPQTKIETRDDDHD